MMRSATVTATCVECSQNRIAKQQEGETFVFARSLKQIVRNKLNACYGAELADYFLSSLVRQTRNTHEAFCELQLVLRELLFLYSSSTQFTLYNLERYEWRICSTFLEQKQLVIYQEE